MVYKDKDIFYIDITRFSRYLKTYSQSVEELAVIEHQILSIWPFLLWGSSRIWWKDIFSFQNQADYLKSSLQPCLTALENRFMMNTIKAVQSFYGTKLTFKDFVAKNFIFHDWFLKKIHQAQMMDSLVEDNNNWLPVM